MTKPLNYGHFDYVPLAGHTKEWFQKDIKTIKNSTKATIKRIHWLFLGTLLFTAIVFYATTLSFNLVAIFLYAFILGPLAIIGYFLLHVMKTKGYDVRAPGP